MRNQPASPADDGATTGSDLRRAYAEETNRVVSRRVRIAASIYLFAIGVYGVLDVFGAPSHGHALVVRLVSHAVICLVGIAAIRRPWFASHACLTAAGFACALTLAGSVYNAAVGTPPERYAMYLVCLLSGMAVHFPWGWRCQTVAALASCTAYALAVPWSGGGETTAHGALALVVISATTIVGSAFLEYSRYDALVQTALQREEAEVTAALVGVGETLSAHLHEPEMIARVNALARELVDCDATATFVCNPDRSAFVLATVAGTDGPAAQDTVLASSLSRTAPLVARLLPNELVELPDTKHGQALPPESVPRWLASGLVVPMARGDEIIGVMLHARRTPGTFSPAQRRLALGIAHSAAIALANAALIADLQSANRLKCEFVSTMSHELRTPLNVILGFTDMARDAQLPSDERDRCLARIDASGRDLLSLIEDTLEISRMEAGRDDVRLEPVALRDFWAELGTAAARMPRAAAVKLLWPGDIPDVSLLSDRRKLTVIVRNLVGNALKFTERGWVRADVAVEAGDLVLRVADTGIGIRPEDQRVIFEMFRQADGSDSRRYGGVGLGLHIVRRTVEQLGGALHLDSARGRGSVFTVRLPALRNASGRAA